MRNYLLPAVVCAAIGALLFLLLKRNEPTTPAPVPTPETVRTVEPEPTNPLGEPAKTRTALDEHAALRELQRSLSGNLANAGLYRQRVCEDMAAILASEKLSKDLLETIKEYIDDEDARRRDVVLGILRVFENPEATRLIAENYYTAKDEGEQVTLLEAMSKPFHDPKTAVVWGLDKALNAASQEHRDQAFDILKTYVEDRELLVGVSIDLYGASLDARQRQIALRTIGDRGDTNGTARSFLRRVLRSPQNPDDIMNVMITMPNWADDNDASRLEQLAGEYPAMSDVLRSHAREIRRLNAERANPGSPRHDEFEKMRQEDMERVAREEAERKEGEGVR